MGDAKNSFDGYIHSMRSATEGSGENKGLSEKMDSDEKEKILDALKDGQSWLDSNPEADPKRLRRSTRRSRASALLSSRSTTAEAPVAPVAMRKRRMKHTTSCN